MNNILRLLERFAREIYTDRFTAAATLDEIGNLVKELARELRTGSDGIKDGGGMRDYCKLRVGSPDGTVTETTTRG